MNTDILFEIRFDPWFMRLFSKIYITLIVFLIIAHTHCNSSSKQSENSKSNVRAVQESTLSQKRLVRLRKFIQRSVNENQIAGAVILVMHNGKIGHIQAAGIMDEGKPMRGDTIFRIASMSKPITSVAVMMLVEERKLSIDEPISKYIPEFKNMQVGIPEENRTTLRTVPAKTEITIRHLLTHTSGILYRFSEIEPWSAMYKNEGISDGLSQTDGNLANNVKKIAKMPLLHHPGEQFTYGLSTDVLGYLIEVVSKMSLDEFFQKRIFQTLKMEDTSFYLSDEKLSRLAPVFETRPDGGVRKLSDSPVEIGNLIFSASFPYKGPRTYYSGGAGLLSTVHDYARFAQMILNGGVLDGARILNAKTIQMMTSNQIGEMPSAATLNGFGFGFGIFKNFRNNQNSAFAGQYGWSGFFHTSFFIDPHHKLIGIFMSQFYPSDLAFQERFRELASSAILN